MKNRLLIFIVCIGLYSCEKENKVYTLKYVVFYPNHADTVVVESTDYFNWFTFEGTNQINNGSTIIYKNTAPFKILSYTVKKIENEPST